MTGSESDRLRVLRAAVERDPDDARARYFLAHEWFRVEQWEEAATHLRAYLGLEHDDEGAGWRDYGTCLARLGRTDEAREAYRRGIEAARAHDHADLADDITLRIEDL